jgi:two-component system chemotaxis response regulator CheY
MSKHFQKIMIVDDSRVDRFILRKIIEKVNLADEIVETDSGIQALNLLSEASMHHHQLPEIIFLDINMPVVDGFEFLEAFTELSKKYMNSCRVVMTCSLVDAAEKKRAYQYHCVSGYYIKPLTQEILLHLKEQVRHTNAS